MIPGVTLDDTSEVTDQEMAAILTRVASTGFTQAGQSSSNKEMIHWGNSDSPAQCASDRARLFRLLNSKQRRL